MNSYEISDEVKTQLELESEALAVMSLLGLMRYAAKHGANRLVIEEIARREARTRWPTGDEAARELAEAMREHALDLTVFGEWKHARERDRQHWIDKAVAVLQRLAKGGSHADAD